nr:immunoglobulin light chain junction region [Macaca mulatta]
SMIWHNNVYIF